MLTLKYCFWFLKFIVIFPRKKWDFFFSIVNLTNFANLSGKICRFKKKMGTFPLPMTICFSYLNFHGFFWFFAWSYFV